MERGRGGETGREMGGEDGRGTNGNGKRDEGNGEKRRRGETERWEEDGGGTVWNEERQGQMERSGGEGRRNAMERN